MPVLGRHGDSPPDLLLYLWGSAYLHSNSNRSPGPILSSCCRAAHTGIYGFCGPSWRWLGFVLLPPPPQRTSTFFPSALQGTS